MLDRLIIALANTLQRRAARRAWLSFTDAELRAAIDAWRQEAGL
jgi:hypothetical protein